ncbi:hypothetical protein DNI29_10755 [Hymenobacter sediminis]|uniref:DUF3226 domain-containing protein n=1 Tax=Hymenobacter sediminis TaxID=2218621 RepID=UPI000F51392A|nr:DUF3226 domain-containing protein [Hymenobacter sediminis]RPD47907.1 hypothetical protein DNI29_10755 [Hymenobacter sediminis]
MSKERFKQKLLVEGKDDQHVVWALCERFSLIENFDVIDCDGIENVLSQLPIRLKQADIRAVLIVVDADLSMEDRWRSLSGILVNAGYTVPNILPEEGLMLKQLNRPTVGVWLMPDNSMSGMLEDFIKFLVPDTDKLLPEAISAITKIEEEEIQKYSDVHRAKALIHTWLAWQDSPGTPLGLAITKRYLSTELNICQRFVHWLKTGFEC